MIIVFYVINTCYAQHVVLSINIGIPRNQLDHIIPSSRGGDNSFENLGISHKVVNMMKHSLTPEELIEWCIKILEFNNYIVTKTE